MKRQADVFRCAPAYARLLAVRSRGVREARQRFPAFSWTERHVQCVWHDPALRPGLLKTHEGETVRVQHAGRWNLEAGPDFLDAVLVIGPDRRELRGDIEVHVHPHDWTAHGHAADPRYGRVVAHVTWFPGAPPPAGLPAGAIQISLAEPMRANPEFSFEGIDLTAYPYAVQSGGTPPCQRRLSMAPPGRALALLEAAGEERLRRKSVRMERQGERGGPEQALYEEVLCSLGYDKNRAAARRLARRAQLDDLREEADGDPLSAYALLLGVSGLIPSDTPTRWPGESRRFVRDLWNRWWKMRGRWDLRCMPRDAWRLSGLRPHNHPVRRLAAAAVLFTPRPTVFDAILDAPVSDAGSWLREAGARLSGAAVLDFWKTRLSFGGEARSHPVALLGTHRVASMLTNVVVPLLAAEGKAPRSLLAALPSEQENAVIRQMAFTLFGRDHNPRLHRSGLHQQGLIQLAADFCLNHRADCSECPLPALLEETWPPVS